MSVTIIMAANPRTSSKIAPLIDIDLHTVEHGLIVCSLHQRDDARYTMGGELVTNAQLYKKAMAGAFGPVAYTKV